MSSIQRYHLRSVFASKSAQTAATLYLCQVIEVYRQSVKKRRAISPEEKCLLLKPNLTSLAMFTSIPRYTIAREIVGTIYTRCTISTGVVSTFIDIYQNNSK